VRLWRHPSTATSNGVLELHVAKETLDLTLLKTSFHEWKLPQSNIPKCSLTIDLKSPLLKPRVPTLVQQISFRLSHSCIWSMGLA